MNANSKFLKSTWENGNPCIEVDPYDYSEEGLYYLLQRLEKFYTIKRNEVVYGADKIMIEIDLKNESVQIDIDPWDCSLAFRSVILRDEVFEKLSGNLSR